MSEQIHANKVAIVTGACGGIGRATAERLRSDGATVVGLDINPNVVTNLTGERLSGAVCDITDDAALKVPSTKPSLPTVGSTSSSPMQASLNPANILMPKKIAGISISELT